LGRKIRQKLMAKADRISRLTEVLALIAISVVVLLTIRDLLVPYAIYGHSADLDHIRMAEFYYQVSNGDSYPRLNPDFYFGYGSPHFHFYAPLFYYIGSFLMHFGLGVSGAIKGVFIIGLALSGFFMYAFLRQSMPPAAAQFGAIAYVLAPYHLVDMLVRHATGEFLAFAFLPLAMLGIKRGLEGKLGGIVIAAIGVGGLFLSHNLVTMISAPLLIAYFIYEFFMHPQPIRHFLPGFLGPFLGICVSSFYWMPALLEKGLVRAKESLTMEYFRYVDHFVYPLQLFKPFWGYGGSGVGPDDGMSFQIGLAHWIIIAAALVGLFLIKDFRIRLDIGFFSATFFAVIFMSLGVSQFIWDRIPSLAYLQFPWRFLSLAAFLSSVLVGYTGYIIYQTPEKYLRWGVLIIATVLLIFSYLPYTKAEYALWDQIEDKLIRVKANQYQNFIADTSRYLPLVELADLEYIRGYGKSATARDDYLPRTVEQKPSRMPERVAFLGLGRNVLAIDRIGPNNYNVLLNVKDNDRLFLSRFYFPGWRAMVDGSERPVDAAGSYGLVSTPVRPGDFKAHIWFDSTPFRTSVNIISAIAALVLMLLFAFSASFTVIRWLHAIRGPQNNPHSP